MGSIATASDADAAGHSPEDTAAARTLATIAALKAALDQVYDEDDAQELRRLVLDYRQLTGSPPPAESGDPERSNAA